jgi:hypothetical protein
MRRSTPTLHQTSSALPSSSSTNLDETFLSTPPRLPERSLSQSRGEASLPDYAPQPYQETPPSIAPTAKPTTPHPLQSTLVTFLPLIERIHQSIEQLKTQDNILITQIKAEKAQVKEGEPDAPEISVSRANPETLREYEINQERLKRAKKIMDLADELYDYTKEIEVQGEYYNFKKALATLEDAQTSRELKQELQNIIINDQIGFMKPIKNNLNDQQAQVLRCREHVNFAIDVKGELIKAQNALPNVESSEYTLQKENLSREIETLETMIEKVNKALDQFDQECKDVDGDKNPASIDEKIETEKNERRQKLVLKIQALLLELFSKVSDILTKYPDLYKSQDLKTVEEKRLAAKETIEPETPAETAALDASPVSTS